jgi:hypothetical protein
MNANPGDARLRALGYVSGVYDLALALPMLFAPEATAQLFGAPPPVPVLNAQLNGVFTLTLAVGYFWAARAPPSAAVISGPPACWRSFWGPRSSSPITSCADRRRPSCCSPRATGTLGVVTLALLLLARR